MTLAYDVAGDGPAVLLLHSTVVDRRMWDPQVPALVEAGFRAVRCDLSGFGDSPLPADLYNDADDVLAVLSSLGVGDFAMVGSSGGGRVALEIAARRPSRVSALLLLCTAAGGFERGPELRAFGEREDALLEAGDLDGAADLNAVQWLGPEADQKTIAAVRAMQRHVFDVQWGVDEEPEQRAYEYDLEAVTAPTLLVTGAHDLPDFRRIADHLASVIPGAKRLELPWAGHLPSLERPDLVNPLMLEFLSSAR
jgi:pimeloyl-ACP methyl ester carboxylesterase